MRAVLEDIAESSGETNRYQGDARLRAIQAELAGPSANAPLDQRWHLLRLAGIAALRVGKEREGIDLLTRACELLPKVVEKIGPERANETIFQLGVGHMRLGESENCCARNAPESCIVPIRGAAIHTRPEGSRAAIAYFGQVLKNLPSEHELALASRWLLNIAAMTLAIYPEGVPEAWRIPESAFTSEVPFPRFENVAGRLGIDRFNCSGGVVIEDFDGDERLDILTSTWEPRGPLALYLNRGDRFEDVTQGSGLEGIVGGLNLLPADYDNDGDLDFLVLRGAWLGANGRHPNSLVRNNGDTTFTDVTYESGIAEPFYPTQTAAWADYDGDGDLDLFVGNETTSDLQAPCQLFENLGDGRFEDRAAEAGVRNMGFSKASSWGDYDNDGDPDLFVSNLQGENRLYRNDGAGRFEDVAGALGLTLPERSFPAWFWDFDNDGWLDLFVSAYSGKPYTLALRALGKQGHWERARLYRGDGKGGFEDVGAKVGLDVPMLPMGSNFGDVDGDGLLDFYLGTGDPDYASLMPNLMFVQRPGKGFVDVTMAGGFGHLQKGHGVAFADIDHDGDLDVFEQMGGAYIGDRFRDVLFENPGFGARWIALRCVGRQSNRSAIGTRIKLTIETATGRREIHRHVSSGGTFGASPFLQLVGLGDCTRILALEVSWPASGLRQKFESVPLDRHVRIVEGTKDLEEFTPGRRE